MKRGRVIIAGSLAQRPGIGGHAWVFLQYLLGLRQLGFEVLFLDWLDAAMCRDTAGGRYGVDESRKVRYLAARAVVEEYFDSNKVLSRLLEKIG